MVESDGSGQRTLGFRFGGWWHRLSPAGFWYAYVAFGFPVHISAPGISHFYLGAGFYGQGSRLDLHARATIPTERAGARILVK